ncbi:MAG: Uracil-DNA glycosylase, family 4 [Alphaproteobacteria bacterium]|nr:Uracil-DNA glycosylase, family 4 [Alphaproteobacteria bacterium]
MPPLYSPALHSLIDWLVTSGVSADTAEEVAASHLLKPPQPEAREPVQESSGSAAPVTNPVALARPDIAVFDDLAGLNAFCTSWKEMGLAKMAGRSVLGIGMGTGGKMPALMVIGDTPDDIEDRNGTAFSSPANAVIRQAILQAGFPAEDVYFTYLSKWRPAGRRALTPYEVETCAQILAQEIGFIRPKAILALGESVTMALKGDSATGSMKIYAVNKYKNQYLKYDSAIMSSQKGEFLVKNPAMKKSFWFSLLELAATTRQGKPFPGEPDVNYTE